MARFKAGDLFAARREIPDDEAEWPMFIEWRARVRAEETQLDYLEWLDTVDAYEVLEIVQTVNGELDPGPEASSSSGSVAGRA